MTTLTLTPTWFGGLFCYGFGEVPVAEIGPGALKVNYKGINERIAYSQVINVEIENGLFWSTLVLRRKQGDPLYLKGCSKFDIRQFFEDFDRARDTYNAISKLLRQEAGLLAKTMEWVQQAQSGTFWVAHSALDQVTNCAARIKRVFAIPALDIAITPAQAEALEKLQVVAADTLGFRDKANKTFVAEELVRFSTYFDTVEKRPLTPTQRLAVIVHEDNTRVIAGAGSGKTSVMVAKAGYLINNGLCQPHELLLLAFNRDAANELRERIKERLNLDLQVSTFHALGLDIIARTTGTKPSLASWAGNDREFTDHIQAMLNEVIRDPSTTDIVRTYIQSHFAPYHSPFEFQSAGEYFDYLKSAEVISLKGETMKSFEEAEIANFLCLKGIRYSYEADYAYPTADTRHRQYKPDFYLPDANLYIEHFGIARDGSTAPYVNRTTYHAGIEWKRTLHHQHGTMLIETYSYQKREGILLTELERQLRAVGVIFAPISLEKALKDLNADHRIGAMTKLAATFLNHFKGGGHTLDRLRAKVRQQPNREQRACAFLDMFGVLYDRYEWDLRTSKQIDFNDMILSAAQYTVSNRYRSGYRCILVDEFQDISASRARLIKALRDQLPTNRLFCVGDDWQAIYRFAGSDIALMRDFEAHFGRTETVALDRTFRCNSKINAVATRFVLANPAQIRKTVVAEHTVGGPSVVVHGSWKDGNAPVIGAFAEIARRAAGAKQSVLVLGRYRYQNDGLPWVRVRKDFPNLSAEFKTAHGAKGLEADHVIILGMQSGRYGFPSEIADDPLLDLVLAAPENFPHAEERRLFYVALTRARHSVHVILGNGTPSVFVSEIQTFDTDVESRGGSLVVPVYCRSCKTGVMQLRNSSYGAFYGCSHYPRCKQTEKPCRRCHRGLLVPDKTGEWHICNNPQCGYSERACPQCGTGTLVERSGKYGPFFGCTNYDSIGCRYTVKL